MNLEINNTDEEDYIPKLEFNMDNLYISICDPQAKSIFNNGYFGQWTSEAEDELKLEPEEILLLLDRARIEVYHSENGNLISQSELVAHFSKKVQNFWSRYLVYKDLRNRGYVVRIGTRITAPFRIYPRGSKPGEAVSKIVVFPMPEGEDLNLDFLDQIVKQAKIDRKKLLLSVIDSLGDVTYYQASQLELEPNELEYEYRDELRVEDQNLEEEK
ncbi:MAG: tRNA-intron lyase [Candidatus Heimdallarchaeota archaeon]|nr:tRNA-intron lyase [Candidatus Heimdallarchaeota archaeon]